MSRNTATYKTLVLVESPAKCKTIESYLGDGYRCLASGGHVRELASLDDVDFTGNWTLRYRLIAKKQRFLAPLREATKQANHVLLATDDDREGEAIAWHLCEVLGLPVATTPRIVFHEITREAVRHAVAHPRRLHLPLVHAQQARQLLDLVVGFRFSPLLWKRFAAPLSAGRCQTPALRLVYDHERDLEARARDGIGTTTYRTTAMFTPGQGWIGQLHPALTKEANVRPFLETCALLPLPKQYPHHVHSPPPTCCSVPATICTCRLR